MSLDEQIMVYGIEAWQFADRVNALIADGWMVIAGTLMANSSGFVVVMKKVKD
jgi:hypothetical protein